MIETAALLVDHVIPKVAIRQWVVTVPIFLRYIMARNSVILSKILELIIGVITGYYKKKARKTYGIRGGLTGNITLIQRFGSALNLNVHFHTVFLEGIYKEGSDKFYRVDAPTDAEVAKIISTIAIRVNRYLKKRGYIKEENEINTDQLDILERENPLLSDRLSLTDDGEVRYELKTPYSDGTTSIQFTPTELIEKLVALVPPPRIHIIRYHGCLAPHSTHRSHIVPRAADEKADEPQSLDENQDAFHHSSRPYRMAWMKIIKRVFLTDLEHCSQCGGKMKIISAIMDVDVIRRILTHIGVSPDPPKMSPSRFASFQYD